MRDKLTRKAIKAERDQKPFLITLKNLFVEIEDLAGVRLIHLHTKQMKDIDAAVRAILNEARYQLVGRPTANTWEDESRDYFKSLGMNTVGKDSKYTSVHYIILENSRTKRRCELQIRTLMEEVWGEVSHTIDYPHQTDSIACREQLKVLAGIANVGSRLVDAIFASHKDHLLRSSDIRPLTDDARTLSISPLASSDVVAVQRPKSKRRVHKNKVAKTD